MGFWHDLWHTIKQVATLGYDVLKPVISWGKDVAQAAEGGPIAAAMMAVTSGIKNVESGINRFKEDWDDITGPNNGTGSGLSNDINAIRGSVSPHAGIGMMTDALRNVSPDAPDSVKRMAAAAAKFHDGLSSYGDIDAAIKAAGGTPITSHLSKGMSNTVVDHVRSLTGFNAYNATQRHPVFSQASMLPSTSAHSPGLTDSLTGSIPERMAMQYITNLRGMTTQGG